MNRRLWIVAAAVAVLSIVLWVRWGAIERWRHRAAEFACDSIDDASLVAKVKAAFSSTGSSQPGLANLGVSWNVLGPCLNMKFDDSLGEKDHPLLPLQMAAASTPIALPPTSEDTASIAPRHNIWWDARSDMGAGRVMARVTSRHGYAGMGLIEGANYLIVWGGYAGSPLEMAMLNNLRVTRITNPDFREHGPVMVPRYHYVDGDPPVPTSGEDLQTALANQSGHLSPSALKCRMSGLKACFVDSKDVQRANPTPGLGIGFGIFQGGGSQPWVACSKYGCCCGGQQCHS